MERTRKRLESSKRRPTSVRVHNRLGPVELDLVLPPKVMPPSPFSLLLAATLDGRGVRRALDLGCGSGVQGIVLAKLGARRVTCVDVAAASVRATRRNAAENGVARIVDARRGNLFEPVAGERFDLIVSNPPTLPKTRATPDFANGGVHGREILDGILRGSGSHLVPGGVLQIVVSSLTDFAVTERMLREGGFAWDIVSTQLLHIREFYVRVERQHHGFLSPRRLHVEKDGQKFEELRVYRATYKRGRS